MKFFIFITTFLFFSCTFVYAGDPPPEPNADINNLYAEWQALEIANLTKGELVDLELRLEPSYWDLQKWCAGDKGCLAAHYGPLIILLYPPKYPHADRCATFVSPRTGISYIYARLVMHELLHTQGFHHGEEMTKAENKVWKIYQEDFCRL